MWSHDCGLLPVVSANGRVIGVITDRDICIAIGTREMPASRITCQRSDQRRLLTYQPDDEIHAVLKTMKMAKIRRLPVTGKTGAFKGILSMNDIVLRARHYDGTKKRGGSYEDLVNTFLMICQHRLQQASTGWQPLSRCAS